MVWTLIVISHYYLPFQSCLLISAGIVLGIVMQLTSGEVVAVLEPDPFFLILLPPIILEAGYFMPNRLFFDHIGTILLMAVIGTIFNMFTVGSALYACGLTGIYTEELTPNLFETFLFASLIVAVDPVAVLAVFEVRLQSHARTIARSCVLAQVCGNRGGRLMQPLPT